LIASDVFVLTQVKEYLALFHSYLVGVVAHQQVDVCMGQWELGIQRESGSKRLVVQFVFASISNNSCNFPNHLDSD
jgi:hypothetical protein